MATDNLDHSNTFSVDGAKYLFHISLYCNTTLNAQVHGLDNKDIILFEYSNVANKLFIEASLQYSDRYGMVDKYINKQYGYCDVLFCKLKSEAKDEAIGAGTPHKDLMFVHKFFIKSILVLNRLNNVISYKIDLVSCNWLNCMATLTYSNYDKPPETTILLIKMMLKLNNLNIDDETFGKVKSEVKLNFITNGNDNTLTTVKYLLDRQYYYQKKDDVIKFLYYHDIDNKYCMFDMKNMDTILTVDMVLISLFNTQSEQLITTLPANFGSVTKFPNTEMFKALYDKKVTDYDYLHNKFVDKPIKENDLLDIYKKNFNLEGYKARFEKRFTSLLKYESRTTFWNSKMLEDIYENMMSILLQNNTLVINTNGNIVRKPSSVVIVNVDRLFQMVADDTPDSIDEVKNKFKAYEGHWVVVKTHHIIEPNSANNAYRQNLVLTRNFVPEDANERSKLS